MLKSFSHPANDTVVMNRLESSHAAHKDTSKDTEHNDPNTNVWYLNVSWDKNINPQNQTEPQNLTLAHQKLIDIVTNLGLDSRY